MLLRVQRSRSQLSPKREQEPTQELWHREANDGEAIQEGWLMCEDPTSSLSNVFLYVKFNGVQLTSCKIDPFLSVLTAVYSHVTTIPMKIQNISITPKKFFWTQMRVKPHQK